MVHARIEDTRLYEINKRHKRRDEKNKTPRGDKITRQQWNRIISTQKNKCAICGIKFTGNNIATMDHILPLSRGGCHSSSNIQALCRLCNSSKGNSLERDKIQTYFSHDYNQNEIESPKTKQCSMCLQIFPIEEFRAKSCRCKSCNKIAAKESYQRHKYARIEGAKRWYNSNKERARNLHKEWLLKHPDYMRDYSRKHYHLKKQENNPSQKTLCDAGA